MSKVLIGQLQAGIIFGDSATQEYVYLPSGEIGVDNPLCVLERSGRREDISCEEAVVWIHRLSLKPAIHPILGKRSF